MAILLGANTHAQTERSELEEINHIENIGPVVAKSIYEFFKDMLEYGGDFDNFYWDVKENIYSLLIFDIIQADAPISDTLKEEIKKDGITIYENKPKSLTTSIFQNQ